MHTGLMRLGKGLRQGTRRLQPQLLTLTSNPCFVACSATALRPGLTDGLLLRAAQRLWLKRS